MIFRKQTIKHDPEQGQYGDCYRTALGCLLNLEPEEVPHFMGDPSRPIDEIHQEVDRWLEQRGLTRAMFAFGPDLESLNQIMERLSPRAPYLLDGVSPRGSDHTVVYRAGQLLHDPAPDGGGLVGPTSEGYYWVTVLCPLSRTEDDVRIPLAGERSPGEAAMEARLLAFKRLLTLTMRETVKVEGERGPVVKLLQEIIRGLLTILEPVKQGGEDQEKATVYRGGKEG